MEKRRDNQWKTMAISGIETQGSKVRKLCIEVLGFSNDGIEKNSKKPSMRWHERLSNIWWQ